MLPIRCRKIVIPYKQNKRILSKRKGNAKTVTKHKNHSDLLALFSEVKKCKKGIVSAVDNVGKCKMGGGGMTCVGVANKTEAEKIVKALIP